MEDQPGRLCPDCWSKHQIEVGHPERDFLYCVHELLLDVDRTSTWWQRLGEAKPRRYWTRLGAVALQEPPVMNVMQHRHAATV